MGVGTLNTGAMSQPKKAIRCPKCEAVMAPVFFDAVKVDQCRQCQGIWLASSALEALRSLSGSESIDTGDARVGRALDAQQGVRCPVCEEPMARVPDHIKQHVWYESCRACKGVFLDAGELRELGNPDLFALFDRLLEPD